MRSILALFLLAGCPAEEPAPSGAPSPTEPADPFHDPIARPEEPTLSPDSFNSAERCASCHPAHFEQWSGSMHAYAMVDPVFRAMTLVRQADLNGTEDQFCTSCHSAIGTRGGEIVDNFSWGDLSPIVQEGITCEACHKIASVERVDNAGHVLDADGPIRGPIADPVASPFHSSAYSPIFEGSELCGSCHDVVETDGLDLERPYEEWQQSPAYDEGRNCQTCHMPSYEGPAAVGGPTRTLHDHRWVGVDVPLADGFVSEAEREVLRGEVRALLEGSGTVLLEAAPVEVGQQLDLLVTVRNEIDAHNLPTGSTFVRQTWLEVVATDATGRVLYETGTLDANGDLRNVWSALDPYGDDDLIVLSSGFVDELGVPTLFSWRAAEQIANAIPPLHDRTWTLFVPTDDAVGPITVRGRLRFRSHAPYLLRALGLPELVDELEVIDIDAHEIEVPTR